MAATLDLVHQQVNQTCRRRADQKRIIRELGPDRLIINRLPGQTAPPPSTPPSIAPDDLLTEDEIKRALKAHLERQGYTVEVRWGRTHGIDIDARSPKGRLIIEAKGQVVSQQQQTNYSIGALGELAQRFSDPDAGYALALPDEPRSQGLVGRLPRLARERLNPSVFFVSRDHDGFRVKEA